MNRPHYRGLTWDHPRGYRALQAAASEVAAAHGLSIDWAIQPLEGFESHSIADLCSRYDLVVLDHPHIGEAVASDCLVPIEAVLGLEELASIEEASIGPSLASYCYADKVWALPLDAATQVMAYHPGRFRGKPPETWDAVAALSEKGGIALSMAGPHAILCLLSIAVALGEPPASRDPAVLISEPVGTAALEVIKYLSKRSVSSVADKNPIGILEHMSRNDDVALCPLIYGYVNYTRPRAGAQALAFADAPREIAGGRPGSTLGGTGIGVTRNCPTTGALEAHLRWLMSEEGQRIFIPAHDGQPSSRAAWHDPAVNAAWGDFYRSTSATLEAAYVRPRHPGYIAWQGSAAGYLRSAIAGEVDSATIVRELNRTFQQSIGDERR